MARFDSDSASMREVHGEAEASYLLPEIERSLIFGAEPNLELQRPSESSSVTESLTSGRSSLDSQPSKISELPRFASRSLLCPWIPEADPESRRSKTVRSQLKRPRSALVLACVISTLVFLINTVGGSVLRSKHPNGRLFTGDCSTAATVDSALHILINILSSLVLGASNLCMQLLVAPTRKEIDKAHARRHWLNIGIPSTRNLWYISWNRKIAWFVLGLTSLPLRFLYNSVTISVQPENAYEWVVVTPDFLTGARFDVADATSKATMRADARIVAAQGSISQPPDMNGTAQDQQRIHGIQSDFASGVVVFSNLSNVDCLSRYIGAARDASDVILVSSFDLVERSSISMTDSGNSLLVYGNETWAFTPKIPRWQCEQSNTFSCSQPNAWRQNESVIADWNIYGYRVDYCLSRNESLNKKCSIKLMSPVLIAICVANLCKCICIFYVTAFYATAEDNPIATLGDAAVSFLMRPDHTTEGLALAERTNIDRIWEQRSPQRWEPVKKRWLSVVSVRLWRGVLGCWVAYLVVVTLVLGFGFFTVRHRTGLPFAQMDMSSFGFGQSNLYEITDIARSSSESNRVLYISILFANCWQVALSILYSQYNAVLTAFLVGHEWSRFACSIPETTSKDRAKSITSDTTGTGAETIADRRPISTAWQKVERSLSGLTLRKHEDSTLRVKKTLRVSVPQGIQRSTYSISMPLRYGIPLIATMSLLHWLTSQSVFVLAGDTYRTDGSLIKDGGFYTNGFSLQAIIAALIVVFLCVVAFVALSLRSYPAGVPVASSCSAAISAACHPSDGDDETYLFPLQWGVVSYDKDGIGHCSLTTARDVTAPIAGKLYA